jgi:D-tyrosyl-tRNA(Tyr) deacylase
LFFWALGKMCKTASGSGRRPSFSDAARPEAAEALFDLLCAEVAEEGIPVATGSFGEMMMVELVNDGPVTILLESRRAF